MNPCKLQEKCKKTHCPYFHTHLDRRPAIDSNFLLLPKNRGGSFSQVNPHLSIYKELFLDILFTEKSRTCVHSFNHHTQQVQITHSH